MCGSRVVKVLYGKKANIICTLTISDTYPSESSVSLQSVDGLPETLTINTLQVSSEGYYLYNTCIIGGLHTCTFVKNIVMHAFLTTYVDRSRYCKTAKDSWRFNFVVFVVSYDPRN